MPERRKLVRTRVLKGAKCFIAKSSVIDCVVRDLTDAGAGIDVPNTIDLPETLDLTLNGGHSIRPARSVWRTINKIGVEFTDSNKNRRR
jgi:PilZ domain